MIADGILTSIVVFAPREKTRTMVRAAFPRRRCRVVFARTLEDFNDAFRKELIDAAVVDVAIGYPVDARGGGGRRTGRAVSSATPRER